MSWRPASSSRAISRMPSALCSAPGPLGICAASVYGLRTVPMGCMVNMADSESREV